PHLESNLITMIGCTTSNPYHAINPAIRSRCHLFELKSLEVSQIKIAIERELTDPVQGYGNKTIKMAENALQQFAHKTNVDSRAVLKGLECVGSSNAEDVDRISHITLDDADQCMQKKIFSHDKGGDAHYDVICAFQKSIRGSD